MKTILALMFVFGATAYADSPMETWYTCHIEPSSTEIGRIEISFLKDTGQFFMTIQRHLPEKVEVAEAIPLSDFTMEGYYSGKFNASVMFFDANDEGGERQVLQLDRKEFPLSCTSPL